MSRPITIFRSTNGLNTKTDPARIYSSSKGIQDLAVAGDVDVTDTGRISRRKGYTLRKAGSFHSAFCDGGDALVVSGTDLCILNPDYTLVPIATVTAGAKASYTQINNRIYWCNAHERGYVEGQQNHEWIKGNYVGPETKRAFSNPPTGTIVAYYRNRIYIAQDNTLWYSEPGAYGAFDLARGFFMYASSIRMIRPVDDGIYVSSSNNTYFLSGKTPLEFEQTMVANFPAIKGSDKAFRGSLVFQDYGGKTIIEGVGKSAMWMSNEGVCLGGAGGRFTNLTQDRIQDFPDGITGSGLVHNGRYVGLIDP